MKTRFAYVMSALLLAAAGLLLTACGSDPTPTPTPTSTPSPTPMPPTVLAITNDYHPFNFINDAGEVDGLDREVGEELCRRANIECAWEVHEWDTLIPNLMAGEFDAVIAGMSITSKREELIDFTEAYYPPVPSVYIARAGEGAAALNGRIGASVNTIFSDYFTEIGEPFVPLDGSVNVIIALLNNDVDAVIVDHGYAVDQLSHYEGQLEIVGDPVQIDRGLGVGVRKGSPLEAKLDEALASMKADGSLNALLLKWIGADAATF